MTVCFLVLSGIVIGALGIWATRLLVKGRANAYRLALIALIASLAVGILHMATSRALRGASMPVDFIVYATALSLVVFLLFHILGVCTRAINRSKTFFTDCPACQ